MGGVSRAIDRVEVTFDDPNLVANAGLLVVATLASRLGLEALINGTVRLAGRVGGVRPGRKILTLVHTIVVGASHIDHADMLRAGATQRVLPFRVMAPSTLGTFLRSFSSVMSANSTRWSPSRSVEHGGLVSDPAIVDW